MDWKDRAKAFRQRVERSQATEAAAEAAAERRKQEEVRAAISEYERVVAELGPRVEKVCKFFAESVCGKLEIMHVNRGPEPYWDRRRHPPPNTFRITVPGLGPGGPYTEVKIYRDTVDVGLLMIPVAEFTEDKVGEALAREAEELLPPRDLREAADRKRRRIESDKKLKQDRIDQAHKKMQAFGPIIEEATEALGAMIIKQTPEWGEEPLIEDGLWEVCVEGLASTFTVRFHDTGMRMEVCGGRHTEFVWIMDADEEEEEAVKDRILNALANCVEQL